MKYFQQVFKPVGNNRNSGCWDSICPTIEKIIIKTSCTATYDEFEYGIRNNQKITKKHCNDKLKFENEDVVGWCELVTEITKWQAKLHQDNIITIKTLDVHFQCFNNQDESITRDIDKVLIMIQENFGIANCSMKRRNQNVYVFQSCL